MIVGGLIESGEIGCRGNGDEFVPDLLIRGAARDYWTPWNPDFAYRHPELAPILGIFVRMIETWALRQFHR
jgi:hypothetical protein